MKEKKRCFERFSFYDRDGITARLEKMAENGWMIVEIGNLGWVYRAIPPQQLHFAVTYFPKASEFDPEPTEEQRTFQEFCEYTGWKLACVSGKLQIYYNEQSCPTPIETEPTLEVQAIHRSAKGSFLISYGLLLLVAIMNLGLWCWNFWENAIGTLSSPSSLLIVFANLILLTVCAVELICYFYWYAKAKKAAKHREFTKPISTGKVQNVLLALLLIGSALWFIDYRWGGRFERWILITSVLSVWLPILVVREVHKFLKRRKASRGVNRTVTILASFLAVFACTGLCTSGILYASRHGAFAESEEETYEYQGNIFVAAQDEIPLKLEDLTEVDPALYSTMRNGERTFLLGEYHMTQWPRFDAADYRELPRLDYDVVEVRFAPLYALCMKQLLTEKTEKPWNEGREYRAEPAQPWNAEEVYRLYDPEWEASEHYLLCYADRIVEVTFEWELTEAQKAVVGEKFGG